MLFNSFEFIFAFLPVTYILFRLIIFSGNSRPATLWLALASVFFYGWFKVSYVFIVMFSVLFNYMMSRLILQRKDARTRKPLMGIAVAANVFLLGYYKYTNFFVDNINALLGSPISCADILLPIGISFFTFQQIGFIVDVYRNQIDEYSFQDYFMFICFFPQFIAGPIVHHSEILPQLRSGSFQKYDVSNLSVGLSLFAIGLFKKVLLADGIAVFVEPVFGSASLGGLTLIEAWGAALCYTLQLYFDFSGYSDMAIGLGRVFGVHIPVNFNSPYRSYNITEFWRRWHITLSRFFREYLYIPLGGNRRGTSRKYFNLMVVMLVCGFWHGAGWNFVFWGFIHGVALVIHNVWQQYLKAGTKRQKVFSSFPARAGSWLITFLFVVVAWVVFRAENLHSAFEIIKAMTGLNGIALPMSVESQLSFMKQFGVAFKPSAMFHFSTMEPVWIAALLVVATLVPNPEQLFRKELGRDQDILEPVPGYMKCIEWRPTLVKAIVLGAMFAYTLMNLQKTSVFLYFQF